MLTSARLRPPPPLSAFRNPLPPCQHFETPSPSAADVICERSLTSAAQHAQSRGTGIHHSPLRPALSHNRRRASCLRRMPIIRRPTHGASLGELLEQLREGDYAPLFEDKNTMLFGKLVKNFSPKTSNKITFSLSLLESESHYTVIVTHFFRLLKFFRN